MIERKLLESLAQKIVGKPHQTELATVSCESKRGYAALFLCLGEKMEKQQDFLEHIFEKENFLEDVHSQYYTLAEEMGVLVNWNKGRAVESFLNWHHDLLRMERMEPKIGKPDHIKCAAHLIYWLRRNPPVDYFTIDTDRGFTKETPSVEFMLKYGREYLAFNYGYTIAKFYELKIEDRDLPEESFSVQSSFPDVATNDFVDSVVHVLKLKNISPHAIILVLKALFLRP